MEGVRGLIMVLSKFDGEQVVNLRIGPSTGGKWMIDFQNYSRAGTHEEANFIWLDFLKHNKL